MKLFTQTIVAISALGAASFAMATDPLANTRWQTYDDGEPKAVVAFTESNGVLSGKIVSTVRPEGQRFVGTTVVTNLRSDGDGTYSGGTITDPENGRDYRLTGTLNGNTLNLRGHVGPFSRSQVWRKQ